MHGLGKHLKNTAPLTPSTLFPALIAPARKQSAPLDGSLASWMGSALCFPLRGPLGLSFSLPATRQESKPLTKHFVQLPCEGVDFFQVANHFLCSFDLCLPIRAPEPSWLGSFFEEFPSQARGSKLPLWWVSYPEGSSASDPRFVTGFLKRGEALSQTNAVPAVWSTTLPPPWSGACCGWLGDCPSHMLSLTE